MKNTRSIALVLSGAVIGTSLAGPAAGAATEYFQAQRTAHPIYVDGKQVQLETYAIDGNNYVKLRDVGKAVGFEVYWDGSAAQVFSGKPTPARRPPRRTTAKLPILPSSRASSTAGSTTPSGRHCSLNRPPPSAPRSRVFSR